MRVSGFTRYAFVSACVGAAMLSGCAGSRSSISAPGAMPQIAASATYADRGKSWILPEAKNEDLIYATGGSLGTCVFGYPGQACRNL